ncbi:MAG: YeeE/YedE family protein [Labilithrix sp.]|nr:YeeE/YedE family protein [Labilithrix sp.]MCW5830911.1 YeeE/YedE family protein [Labilithrix sp.]
MRAVLVGFGAGALFGAGLVVSGMTRPSKVLGFLDVAGAWDASLAFVMVGAIAVHAAAYQWIRRRGAPRFAPRLDLPAQRRVDVRLLAGAALFGVGWGLGGFCPGPALTSVAALAPGALVFVAAMTAGMLLQHLSDRSARAKPSPPLEGREASAE